MIVLGKIDTEKVYYVNLGTKICACKFVSAKATLTTQKKDYDKIQSVMFKVASEKELVNLSGNYIYDSVECASTDKSEGCISISSDKWRYNIVGNSFSLHNINASYYFRYFTWSGTKAVEVLKSEPRTLEIDLVTGKITHDLQDGEYLTRAECEADNEVRVFTFEDEESNEENANSNYDRNAMVLSLVAILIESKLARVPDEYQEAFLNVCRDLEIKVNGGAITNDCKHQFFYID